MRPSFGSIILACVLCGAADARTVEKKDEDGNVVLKYAVDSEGRKDGAYTEFYPSGKVKVRATYKVGQLEGTYTENDEGGRKRLTAVYRAGKLDGLLTRYDKGRPVLKQPFKDDKPVYSRSLKEIKKKLAEINAVPKEKPDSKLTADREATLRGMKAYRYLAGVPYDNLALDEQMNKEAQAAAKICAKLNRLDHTPKNPGMPEAEYKLAYRGASHSNLAWGYGTLANSMDMWMNDSDESNIDRLGHRRWCLHPLLRKVGFGKSGRFMAMWAFDRSQPRVPEWDFVSCPAAGLTPVEYFRPGWAWSVSLNPRKYRKPGKSVAAKIYATDRFLNKVGEPLKLTYQNVDTLPFGVPNCIIFQPGKGTVAAGKRYLVEIEGVRRSSGSSLPLQFLVEFVSVK